MSGDEERLRCYYPDLHKITYASENIVVGRHGDSEWAVSLNERDGYKASMLTILLERKMNILGSIPMINFSICSYYIYSWGNCAIRWSRWRSRDETWRRNMKNNSEA